ncbi:MAG TPA: hypothetical protein VNC22_23135 [Sporichthya sp.]|nr:hypothetical protein [Sporichthya sp.]
MPLACSVNASVGSCADIEERDLKIKRGDDKVVRFVCRDCETRELIDWTGWTFACKVKDSTLTNTWVVATISGDANGVIAVLFPKAQTSLLTPGDEGRYDVQGTDPDGLDHTVVEGDVLVTADVT